MKDLVTVFTPVYNRKNLIGNLYQSLLSQTYKNFEWIIVDDGSTDDIDEIISDYPFMHLLYSQLLVCQRVCLQNTVCLICK